MSSEQSVTEAPEQQQAPRSTGGEESFGASGGFELDEDGQRIPHGMGQSKSSRRRRRKRKNKGADAGQQGAGQFVGEIQGGQGFAAPVTQTQNPQAGAPQQQAGGGPST